jgi:hypothetical protein
MNIAFKIVLALSLCVAARTVQAQDSLRPQAKEALKRAVDFFSQKVASHGGYVYRVSADLKKFEGEEKTGRDTVWVQPPGTPAVGMAYLDAYELLHDSYLLDAAKATAECLIQGQLRSGGWSNKIDFAPEDRQRSSYRVDPPGKKPGANVTTFDDDKSQSVMRFLIRLDSTLGFTDTRLHEAISYALESVLKAQFPNGAWPQGYSSFPEPEKFPVLKASYPSSWPREFPSVKYTYFYTFNDNTIADTMEMLWMAQAIYGDPRYGEAAARAGDFILLAQMPDPQPAWAQQYSVEMHPVWARKFEPPAISGGESQGLIQVLMQLYVETGNKKYLEPVPRAIEYLRRSTLPEGGLARFYELQTNKPLYFTRKYELTYKDDDLPTHYAFKVSSKVDSLSKQYEKIKSLDPSALAKQRRSRTAPSRNKVSEQEVARVIKSLDERGAWVQEGRMRDHGSEDDTRQTIESNTFIRNIGTLSRYLANTKD